MCGKPRTRKEAIYFKVLRKTAQSKDVTEDSRRSLGYLVSFQATLPSGVSQPKLINVRTCWYLPGSPPDETQGALKLGLRFTAGRHTSFRVRVSPTQECRTLKGLLQ